MGVVPAYVCLPSIQDIFVRASLRRCHDTRQAFGWFLQDAVDSQSRSPSSDRDSDTLSDSPQFRPSLAPYQFWRENPGMMHGNAGRSGAEAHLGAVKSNSSIAKSCKMGAERAKDLNACPKLSREASVALKEWFRQHLTDPMGPYPNRATKEKLAAEINCSRQQVENWFLNARRRWKHSQTP